MDAADRDAVRRPLDHHDHEDTVIGYVIRGEFLDPGDVKLIFARGDGAEAGRLFRRAVAEAERRFEVALAARKMPETTTPRGHKRARGAATADGDEDGTAHGAPRRRRVATGIIARRQELEAAAALLDVHASRPEHLTALDEGYRRQFAYGDTDEFLPVGPADEEEDGTVYGQHGVMPDEGGELDEWFACLPVDPDEHDDYTIYGRRWSVTPDLNGKDGDGQAASELEDFVPLVGVTTMAKGQKDLSPVDPAEDDDDVVNDDGRCGDATPGEVALGEKAERFAPETGEDFIALDPVEDAEAVPGEEESGQCRGVILNEVTLHDGQFASEVEDFLPLDPIEDDDTAYGRECRSIQPVLWTY